MFTYTTTTNRYRENIILVSANGAEIATIKASSHYGKTEYIASATIGGDDRGDYLGRASTIAAAKKKIRDWYNENIDAVKSAAPTSRADVRRLPSFSNSGFYPTPSKLAGKMLACVSWEGVYAILEPSAGKGDLADAVSRFVNDTRNSRRVFIHQRKPYIDCIECDSDLAALLRGKGLLVVHDDFLTFHTRKQYDLCVMNPPFDSGDEHLLHALSLMERGGQIVCLLNAETIRNPYTNRRKVLVQNLREHNARIEFIENAFRHAQRPTDVEIALVYVNIPRKENTSDILSSLRRASENSAENSEQAGYPASSDWLQNMIDGYNFEAALGEKLINEFAALRPYIDPGKDRGEPLLSLKVGVKNTGNNASMLNAYLYGLRAKYWGNLLRRPELTEKMTSAMQQDYNNKVESLSEYDFSRYNIETVMREIAHQLSRGVEESILDLFEKFSAKHSWYPESENNIHYYNGWATNKAHKVGMKVIIPANGCCADKWRNEKLDTYRVNSLISDLERAMNYLDRGETSFRMPVDRAVRIANINDMNKVDFTYFTCTFYKKGTCHIKFKPEASRIIDRLNIFAGQKKNWLPPTYGKKHYADMTAEEQAVIDDFQGADSYEKTIADPSMLISTTASLVALPGM
nr:MAG TPA: Type I restriction enzyme Methylase [Caudoviricetes sp.]